MFKLSQIIPSFSDEMVKISGMTRSARRPISASLLLERDTESNTLEPEELDKEARPSAATLERMTPKQLKALGLMAAGAATYGAASRANQDRIMGRQMRVQGAGGFY